MFDFSRYGCNQVASALIERQEFIGERVKAGKQHELLSSQNKRLGVCIEASRDTLDSVPYMTH